MLINNTTSRFLSGPYIYFGLIFLIVGIMSLLNQQWILAIFCLIVCGYLFGTYTGMEIDTEKRIFREYNKHFGIFKSGQWQSIDRFIGLTVVSMKSVYKIYSRSNRTNASSKTEFRVYFVNQHKKPDLVIKKCNTPEEAQNKMDELALWLHLPVFSVKH